MLDDLRPVLADIADGLGNVRGAQTLRWCAAVEATSNADDRAELEYLRDLVEEIESALDEKSHPGTFRSKVGKLIRGAS
jgi:hypothetical protein